MLRYQRAGERFGMNFRMNDVTPSSPPVPDCLPAPMPFSPERRLMLAGMLTLCVAACSGAGLPGFEQTPAVPAVGAGGVKIALILPLSAGGQTGIAANSLKNAGELAIAEANAPNVQLIVKDDKGTSDGASAAAQEAVNEGAELIVGPLIAANVQAAAAVARAAGRPVIAFSSDASVASRGVYLLSFLIEGYVDRVMDYARSKGKKSFAAMAPQNDYGNVAVAEFQQEAAKLGVRVVTVARYAPGQAGAAAKEIAAVASQVDALFIPEQADGADAVSAALAANGLKMQILGTGIWNDPRVMKLPGLQGAWFAAPEAAGFSAFAERYRAKFNNDPTRLATLSYDAVSLVAALARTQGQQRFAEKTLTNPSGFNGADGVFRFRPDGPDERGLAVMQITNGAASPVSPAPRSFAGG